MTEKVKQFIEDNIELIENNEFDKLYELAKQLTTMHNSSFQWGIANEIGELTSTLRSCEIYPEEYLSHIPSSFLFRDTSLEEFTVPSNIQSIGMNAFGDCGNLKHLTILDGLKYIDFEAFLGCGKLDNVTLPDSVVVIKHNVFRECSNLKTIKLSKNLTNIPQCAFGDCYSLPTIILEEGIQKIEQQAFYGCKNLTDILPSSLAQIESNVFTGCTSLSFITYNSTKAAWRKINKATSWRPKQSIIIHCTDGDITLK